MDFLKATVFDYGIFCDHIDSIRLGDSRLVINALNAYSYVVAKSDPLFRRALREADILLPDGFPVVVAARWLAGRKIRKIAGADIFNYLCRYLNGINGSCFFLGSTCETLAKIHSRLKREYPHLRAQFFSPPFKEEFADEDTRRMLTAINAFKPDIVFMGMTAPKQEKWVLQNHQSIEAGMICSVGAVFDFYAGSVTRPSAFWITLRLEWFIRLIKEPRRLWKRYLVYSPLFFADLALTKAGIKKLRT